VIGRIVIPTVPGVILDIEIGRLRGRDPCSPVPADTSGGWPANAPLLEPSPPP